jgi:WD40 repeat protein
MSDAPDTTARPVGNEPFPILSFIAEEIDQHLQRGERPDVEDYCRRFPQLADTIRARWRLFLAGSDEWSPPTMVTVMPCTEAILAAVARLGLVEAEKLQQLDEELASHPLDAMQLGREMMQRGWLTAFQVNHLLQGKELALNVGPYQLLHRLGEGGMGQVFKARDSRLGQLVALKVIHPQLLHDHEARRRFLRETRSLSLLDHPNIVRAIDAGEAEGRLYLAMEFVEGTDLSRLVKEKGGLPIGQACDCVRQAALALQHAHEQGLVHRDVKPSNLLLTADGPVKMLDLGLARLRAGSDVDGATTITDTGVVMGTPDYVAPEQVLDSKRVDIRADLYSLGCTLYHLLTGRPPFAGGTVGQKLMQHQMVEPEAIAALRPEVPAALAAVVQKLMAKRPEDRYQNPAEVVAVLDHLLRTGTWAAGPFAGVAGWVACPASWLRRAQPDWQGRRLLKALAIVVLMFTSVGLALRFWPKQLTPRESRENERAASVPSPLDQLTFKEIREQERLGTLLPETVQVLGTHQGEHGQFAFRALFHPDGKYAFTAGTDAIRVWDVATMRQRVALPLPMWGGLAGLAVIHEPGKQPVLNASFRWHDHGEILRWDAQTFRPLGRSVLAWRDANVFTFSPDGAYGLSAEHGRSPELIAIRERRVLKRYPGTLPHRGGTAFTADGQRALMAVKKGQFALLETATGRELWRFHGAPDLVCCLAVTPDGKHVLSGDLAGRVWLWEMATNRVVHRFVPRGGPINGLTVSPDGRRALVARMGPFELLDLEDFLRHESPLLVDFSAQAVAMTPDGRRGLAVHTHLGRIGLWDLNRGEELCRRPDNAGEAHCVALSPDGRLALTGRSNLLTLYDIVYGQSVKTMREKGGSILSTVFSPDGSRFAYGDQHGMLHLRLTETSELLWSQPAHQCALRALIFSSDGKRLYSGGGSGDDKKAPLEVGAIRIWDTATGQPAGKLSGHTGEVYSLALSPDGTRLLSGAGNFAENRDCTVRLWDLERGEQLACFEGHASAVTGVAFAPTGKWAASISGSGDGTVHRWDLQVHPSRAGRVLGKRHLRAVAFLGEERIVTASDHRQLTLWSPEGEVIGERLMPHPVNGFALSRDGKYLATANSNGTVYILRLPLRGR